MNKKDIVKILDVASFISVLVATILVVAFEFTGIYNIMKYAIVLYDVCFLSLAAMFGFKVYFAFNTTESVAKEAGSLNENEISKEEKETEMNADVSPETTENIDAELQKKREKFKNIIYLCLSVAAFIFTTIVMVLY